MCWPSQLLKPTLGCHSWCCLQYSPHPRQLLQAWLPASCSLGWVLWPVSSHRSSKCWFLSDFPASDRCSSSCLRFEPTLSIFSCLIVGMLYPALCFLLEAVIPSPQGSKLSTRFPNSLCSVSSHSLADWSRSWRPLCVPWTDSFTLWPSRGLFARFSKTCQLELQAVNWLFPV